MKGGELAFARQQLVAEASSTSNKNRSDLDSAGNATTVTENNKKHNDNSNNTDRVKLLPSMCC